MRPANERPTHYQALPRQGSPPHAMRDQAQPYLTREPQSGRSFQDLLVPSIETASSDAANDRTRQGRQYEVVDGPQDSQPRRVIQHVVEARGRSPEGRKVIVIDDDSPPQFKRRRVVYEDNLGQFRPLPQRDQDPYHSAPRADSHLLPASSVQQRNFLHERLPSRTSQRMYGDTQSLSARPIAGERLPVFEAPGAAFRDVRHKGEAGAVGDSAPQGRMDLPDSYLVNARENSRRVTANMAIGEVGRDRATEVNPEFRLREPLRRPLPTFVPPSRGPRAEEMGRPPYGHQGFVNDFSQARLEPQRARDHLVAAPERYLESGPANYQERYEERPSASFMTLRPGEARSPVRYVERPM